MIENAKKVAELLKLLSNEYRLMILCILIVKPENVSALESQIGRISQSALSQHLNLLKTSGILTSEKHGQNVIYSIADKRVMSVIEVLKENYC